MFRDRRASQKLLFSDAYSKEDTTGSRAGDNFIFLSDWGLRNSPARELYTDIWYTSDFFFFGVKFERGKDVF